MLAWLSASLWIVGATFALLAAVGTLRMPDLLTRMQATSKASTLGLACLLLGTAIDLAESGSVARAASIAAFVMLTTPVATHAVARAAALTDVPRWDGTVLDERSDDAHARSASVLERPGDAEPGESPLGGVR